MKMNGSEVIEAAREAVWQGLNDPHILQQCIPGCSKIESSSPTQMKATVTIKVGPVKANFAGEVKLSNLKVPESYRISGKGSGGFAGFAEGGASIKLTAISPAQTQLDYEVDAQVGGKLAMLGSRLIDSTAQSLAAQFFAKFTSLMKSAPVKAAKKPAAKKPAAKKVAVKKGATKKVAAKKPAKKPAKKSILK